MANEKKEKTSAEGRFQQESWRVFQIMAEFVEGYERLAPLQPAVSVFGSARIAAEHPYYQLAERLGFVLSEAGFHVITGGGPGLMEAVNKGAQRGRSLSIGLNINGLRHEKPNDYQDVSLFFKHFFSRKAMFIHHASAYVVLPGGFGTLDELSEILTLMQTKKSRRIPIFLVDANFWQGLLLWFQTRLVEEKMIRAEDLQFMQVIDDEARLLEQLFAHYAGRPFEPLPEEQRLLGEL
jgi:uncharacterized protein (TIGR00730 family)